MLSKTSSEMTSRMDRAFSRAAAIDRSSDTAALPNTRYSWTASPSPSASSPHSRAKPSRSPAMITTGSQHCCGMRSESMASAAVTWRTRAVLSARSM